MKFLFVAVFAVVVCVACTQALSLPQVVNDEKQNENKNLILSETDSSLRLSVNTLILYITNFAIRLTIDATFAPVYAFVVPLALISPTAYASVTAGIATVVDAVKAYFPLPSLA